MVRTTANHGYSTDQLAGNGVTVIAISHKNATLASLLEISYPVFVVFFAYLFFREWHLNNSVVIGAVFIFSGVALIITGNR